MCASECQTRDGCLSFSFTDGGQTCKTYSRLIGEKESAVVFNTTTYFSKVFVIQRRTSVVVDFMRNWNQYKNGFGDVLGNFWIGNDNLHLLASTPRILRVELEAWDGAKGYAQYFTFQVANEEQYYRLTVQGFSGTLSNDALTYHNGSKFSTDDKDNDVSNLNCAASYQIGWWFKNCYDANLNGVYRTAAHVGNNNAMLWKNFPSGTFTPLKKTKMMIR
ncbi:angiopoietin-related protein 7-like [Argopecten irradians]|uniref:angiopoietin-related protein 7-like n=1 Tax=Argopecten irradians TaxID=31199 RepID=UPI0037180AE9